MKRFLLAIALATGAWAGPSLGQQTGTAIKFEIPVIPDLARHLEFLTAPGYVALALENNDLHLSLSSRLVVKDRESFQVRAGVVRYKGKKGSVYLYDVGITLALGVTDKEFIVPVEVDTSSVSAGVVSARAYPPLAGLLPNEFLERVQFKIASIASIQAQRKLLVYLDQLAKEQQTTGRGFEGMLEAIALEAYNNSSGSGRDRGEAEPLSDQVLLLATVAIWLIGFPIFLLFVRSRRKSARSPTV